MIRAVFFDVGDTLILGHPKHWLWPLLEERGLTAAANLGNLRQAVMQAYQVYDANHMKARSHEEALPLWRDFHHALLEGIGLAEHAPEISGYLAQNWRNPRVWPLVPGAAEVLQNLQQAGYRLGVISNWDVLLPGILEATGLLEHFDHVSASGLVGFAKPDRRIFEHALQGLGVEAAEAVHIGDSVTADLQGAEQAGLRAILFDPYHQNPQALQDLRQLPDLLRSMS